MLELQICKRLNAFHLNIDLCAPEEKIVVLFGASGAGKSMTLAAISGLVTPDSGRIAIGERVLFDSARGIDLPPQQRHIGLVKQDLALFPHLTAAQNIAYGLFNQPRDVTETRVRDFVRLTNLVGFETRKPTELSGGQQQRVALARALAIQPSLLLLDEPFSALDRPTRLELRDEVKRLQQKLRTNVLMVTHDLGEAYALADYLAVFDRGQLLQFDQPDRVLRAPKNLRVAQVVGVKNILPGVVVAPARVRVGERELEAPAENFPTGARVFVCVRPERVTLIRMDRFPPPPQNLIEGDVIEEQSDGTNVTLIFRAQGERLLQNRAFDLQIDTPVYVYERLNLARERHWTVSIKKTQMHVIADEN